MYDRFRICLCHPKVIGLFYKDSFGKVFLYLLSLFLLFLGICAIDAYNTDHFTYSSAQSVSEVVMWGEKSDIVFDETTHQIKGKPIQFDSNGITLCFLGENAQKVSRKFIFHFKENKITVSYGTYVLCDLAYQDMKTDGFSIQKIQSGEIKDIVSFQTFMDIVLDKINTSYATLYFAESFMVGIVYFFMVFIGSLVASFFLNPTIVGKIRVKLCLYSVGVYYLIMTFAVLFGATWLQYAALFIPFIYSGITFTHIIRVENKQ